MDAPKLSENEVTMLIAEDDDGHAELIQEQLQDAGVRNALIRFRDGQEVLDFFQGIFPRKAYDPSQAYLLLLDIRMPKISGVDVLKYMKKSSFLRHIPVIMLTTTDDPREIETCYKLGCSCYVTKPMDFQKFSDTLQRLGLFLLVLRVESMAKGKEISYREPHLSTCKEK